MQTVQKYSKKHTDDLPALNGDFLVDSAVTVHPIQINKED